jgi:galactose mutarotase-like enzyme
VSTAPVRADPRNDPRAHRLVAGDLSALFLPAHGMLCASLALRDVEFLRRVDDLARAANAGATAGIPLLHPWANRLDGMRYHAAGREVTLDPLSPLLHFDANGLPIHGVAWSCLEWQVIETAPMRIVARLDWTSENLLRVFPYPHRVELTASLAADGLTIGIALVAGTAGAVPVSFGFHPYFGISAVPRESWCLRLPPLQRLHLDARGIPTGDRAAAAACDIELGDRAVDDAFALCDEHATLGIEAAGRRVTVEMLHGYRYAQVYAPQGGDCIALEPMTAPTAALSTGRGLTVIEPGERFDAAFRVVVA